MVAFIINFSEGTGRSFVFTCGVIGTLYCTGDTESLHSFVKNNYMSYIR